MSMKWTRTVDSTDRNYFVPEVKCDVICTDWRETKKFSAVLRGDLLCCLYTDVETFCAAYTQTGPEMLTEQPSERRHRHWVDLC